MCMPEVLIALKVCSCTLVHIELDVPILVCRSLSCQVSAELAGSLENALY